MADKNNMDSRFHLDGGELYLVDVEPMGINFHVRLGSQICGPESYIKLGAVLQEPGPDDFVTLHLHGRGGDTDGMVYLINQVRKCKAGVHVLVEGPCYSAHSELALCGQSLTMMPNTFLMFHNYSGGDYGKGAEMKMSVKEQDRHLSTVTKQICFPFLTDEEIKGIVGDRDIFIHWDDKDLKTRLKRHYGAKK